jgi:hypothetical protein
MHRTDQIPAMNNFRNFFRSVVVLAACIASAGCATSIARTAVPIGLADQVQVSGAPQVRYWGDVPISGIDQIARERAIQARAARPGTLDPTKPISYLAISGGGADGAFGAGLLNGWSRSGTRPEFEVVTGVSAGALIAPFAFLGARYDRDLKEVFTSFSTEDLLTPQLLSGLTGGSAISSSAPLERLIEKYIAPSFIRQIAAEHRRGRRLLVGTTNLDSERPVLWNMSLIATLDTPESRRLFRQILLASISIPGVFPPVFIEVETVGQRFQEMHVDGGTTDNAFLLPTGFDVRKNLGEGGATRRIDFYVIANSKLVPSPDAVPPTTLAIASRSIATLIKQQLEGDLLKIYLAAQKNKVNFKLASIPADFNEKSNETFDEEYMRKLFAAGLALGVGQNGWLDRLPGR